MSGYMPGLIEDGEEVDVTHFPRSRGVRRSRARRIGERIGSFISTGVLIATGYVWAKHGVLTALEIWGGVAVIALAAYGALLFPWRNREARAPEGR